MTHTTAWRAWATEKKLLVEEDEAEPGEEGEKGEGINKEGKGEGREEESASRMC